MEVKTGYKQSEAGVIPKEWDAPHLRDLFTFKNGLNKAKRFFGHGTPIVNYMDVYRSRGISSNDLRGRVSLSKEELKAFDVRKGDVFFTRTSETADEVGMTSVMLDGPKDTVFSGFVLRGRPKDQSLDDQFKKYCFSTQSVRKQIIAQSTETTRALTNGRYLGAVAIARPDKHEQGTIATVLGDVDSLLDTLDQLIAKKRDLKQALMQQLLTSQTRLPGFSLEWEVKSLGDLGSTYGGLSGKTKADFGEGSGQYITFMNVMTNVIIDCETFERVKVSPTESQNRIMKGDLLFNGSSETPEEVAMCSVLTADIPNLFLNSFCFGFRFYNGSEADGLFVAYYLRSKHGREMMKALAQGSTRYNLSKLALLKSPFRLPALPEQIAIAAVLTDMDAELATLEQRREKTRDLKQAMMQELLTGKTRLV